MVHIFATKTLRLQSHLGVMEAPHHKGGIAIVPCRRLMIDDIDAVSNSRLKRLTKISKQVPVFLYVAFLAFLWSNVMLSVFTPRNKAVVFIGGYCAFVGVVIYVILAMRSYFDGIGAVTPDSLGYLSNYIEGLRKGG